MNEDLKLFNAALDEAKTIKKSMLEEYLQILEDRKSRDHRKICKDLKLFMTHPLVGSGLPIYLPGGATIRRILERYIQDKELELGYNHVYTPSLASTDLYKISVNANPPIIHKKALKTNGGDGKKKWKIEVIINIEAAKIQNVSWEF